MRYSLYFMGGPVTKLKTVDCDQRLWARKRGDRRPLCPAQPPLEIAQLDDLAALEALLADWLNQMRSIQSLTVDAAQEEPTYIHALAWLLLEIKALFG